MKLIVFSLLGLLSFTGCADHARSAYRDPSAINRYSRQGMAETARNIPMAPARTHGIPRNTSYHAGYNGPGYTPYSASYYLPDTGPRHARLSAEVVPPPYAPGLYGPTRDASSVHVSSGIGGRRFRYADRNPYYGGYSPYYGGYGH